MKLSNSQKGHLSLFIAQVIYAMNYSIAKDIMPKYLHPISLVFLRIAGASILFWILDFFISENIKQKISIYSIKTMFFLSLFGVIINQFFFIYGLSITTPINSAIIMISNPIAVFVFSYFIFKDHPKKFEWKKWVGLILGITGALILILFKGNFSFGSETWLGDLMTLINAISWAIFLIYGKEILQKHHTVTVMKWMFLWGSIVFLPIAFYFLKNENWLSIPLHIYWSITFVVVATTFLAYLLNTYGLKLLSTTTVSMYIYIQPFLATLFAIVLGKDNITYTKIIAGCFVISGIYLVNTKK